MKTFIRQYELIGLLLSLMLATSIANTVFAQRMNSHDKIYFGLETTYGTRSFTFESNLPAIQNLKVVEAGQTYGVIIGSEIIQGKAKAGFFKSMGLNEQPFNLTMGELSFNFHPLNLMPRTKSYFDIYMTGGFDINSVKVTGMYTTTQTIKPAGTHSGGCSSDPDPVSNPDNPGPATPVAITKQVTLPFDANAISNRFHIGLGLQLTIPKRHDFIILFSEIKYGMAISSSSNSPALEQTKASGQLAVDFGIKFGITR